MWIVGNIIYANFAIITFIFLVLGIAYWGGDAPFNIPKLTWPYAALFYYGIVVPASIPFGIFVSLATPGFEEMLEEQGRIFNGQGTEEENQSWEREKSWLKYCNPILLPFSVVILLIRFVIRVSVAIWVSMKESHSEAYHASTKKRF